MAEEYKRPEGTMEVSQLKTLQGVTEQSVRSYALSQLTPYTSHLQDGLVKPIADRIGDALFGGELIRDGFERVGQAGKDLRARITDVSEEFSSRIGQLGARLTTQILNLEKKVTDGQALLNTRVDLLSPLLDYGSAYMGSVNGIFNTGIMPFTNQIGPLRGVEMTANGFKLLDRGLWDIRAQITASWVATVFVPTVRWRVRVTAPNGTLYSEQTATLTDSNLMTQTIVSSVVVPEPGYLVQVEVQTMTTGRGMMGGPRWNRLTVQHISRNVGGHTGAEASQEARER